MIPHLPDGETAKVYIEALAKVGAMVLQFIPKNKKDRTPEHEEILIALSKAYSTTHAYYRAAGNEAVDTVKRCEIAGLWDNVGFLMNKYDETLADRLSAKARYWYDDATWSQEIIDKAQIGLEEINRNVRICITQTSQSGIAY